MTLRAWLYRSLYPLAKIYWFFRRPTTFSAGCIIESDDKILVVKNTYGKRLWSFPGGGIENEETPEKAALREVFEEVGIKLDKAIHIGTFTHTLNYCYGTVYVYAAYTKKRDLIIDQNEILKAAWINKDQINSIKLSVVGKKMFEYYLKLKNG